MKRSKHILTFLSKLKKISNEEIPSSLMVDNENSVDEVFSVADTTGGLIAELDNNIEEIIDKLEIYYEKTGNERLLKKLKNIK